jgi:uncharacterized protein (TIGR03000 family)
MSRTIVWSGRMLVLVAAALLSSAGTNMAMARGGHGGHGGGHHGGSHHGSAHHGSAHHGIHHLGYHHHGIYHHGFYHHGSVGSGVGIGGFGFGGSGFGTYFPGYGSYSYPSYYNGGSLVYPLTCGYYYDVVPAIPDGTQPQHTMAQADLGDSKAHLVILVPDENTEVKIDGQTMAGAGTIRKFQSPELSAGNYSYEVQATWNVNGKPVTQVRTVKVKPGAVSLVSFSPSQQ